MVCYIAIPSTANTLKIITICSGFSKTMYKHTTMVNRMVLDQYLGNASSHLLKTFFSALFAGLKLNLDKISYRTLINSEEIIPSLKKNIDRHNSQAL